MKPRCAYMWCDGVLLVLSDKPQIGKRARMAKDFVQGLTVAHFDADRHQLQSG